MRGEVERMTADPSYFSHEWWDHTYLARGRYAEQLERWFAVFPREQLLVVPSADLDDRPGETYARDPRVHRRRTARARLVPAGLPPRVLARWSREGARAARRLLRASRTAVSTSCSGATSAGRESVPLCQNHGMSDYTIVNIREHENIAPKFGMPDEHGGALPQEGARLRDRRRRAGDARARLPDAVRPQAQAAGRALRDRQRAAAA